MTQMDHYKKFFLKILIQLILTTALVFAHGQHGQKAEVEPQFLAPLENITAVQGRDVVFTCVADNLGEYRVAWIKSDSKAILAIHTHMVALNPRLSVTHNGHNTWKLHISHVQLNDSGSYMCQINTDPMRSQSGYLDVVVPPDILNDSEMNSGNEEGNIPENGTVKLSCIATGVPKPNVQWRREGGRDIILRSSEGRDNKQAVKHVDGMNLTLHFVQRADMGPYMCIASNRIPPSVSKRFEVKVTFKPVVRAVNHLLSAPIHRPVLLQCLVEAFPQPLMSWSANDGTKLYDSEKYQITEAAIGAYTWQMNMTIRNLQFDDFQPYMCSGDNGLGSHDARIRLQELRLPPTSTTTPTTFIPPTTPKPRRKQTQHHGSKQGNHETNKIKETANTILLNNDNEVVGQIETITQPSPKTSLEKLRNTQMPAQLPTARTPWIVLNSSSGAGLLASVYVLGTIPITITIIFSSF